MNISNPKNIQISNYNYELPDNRIAKYPLKERDSSKLLVCNNGKITDSCFRDLPNYLPKDSLLVFNNTKVIQARLHFHKATGANIEIFCLEPYKPADYLLNFQQTQSCSWNCLVGNLKKWKGEKLIKKIKSKIGECNISATLIDTHNDSQIINFEWDNPKFAFSDILEELGELPIPPYLNRETEEQDKKTYQTVYSKIEGSVAAPTAGLHFTDKIFNSLAKKNIETAEVTLHVGAGTFKPVKSNTIEDHNMHREFIAISKEFITKLLNHKGPIIAVGTTSVRTLESLYYIGASQQNKDCSNLVVSQWQPYEKTNNKISVKESLQNTLNYLNNNNLDILTADTKIIIAPGYDFKIVNGIVTNFHQPQSTLLLLVSAFLGNTINWQHLYEYALNHNYRFLSYGDSSLLLKDYEKE